jgi:hypothetical protein
MQNSGHRERFTTSILIYIGCFKFLGFAGHNEPFDCESTMNYRYNNEFYKYEFLIT